MTKKKRKPRKGFKKNRATSGEKLIGKRFVLNGVVLEISAAADGYTDIDREAYTLGVHVTGVEKTHVQNSRPRRRRSAA